MKSLENMQSEQFVKNATSAKTRTFCPNQHQPIVTSRSSRLTITSSSHRTRSTAVSRRSMSIKRRESWKRTTAVRRGCTPATSSRT